MKNIRTLVSLVIILFTISNICVAAELTIAVTGNNRGSLAPCGCKIPSGGLARIATIMKDLKDPNLRIGAGNHFFHHTPMPKEDQIFEQKKAVFQAKMFADMDYDIINVGQFDLCYGLNVLSSLGDKYKLPFISANILDMNGDRAFPAYQIIERNGIEIMFIGICYLSDGFNFKVQDPMKALILLYEEGIFDKADLVVLLADAPAKLLSDFAKEFEGIDMIIASKDFTYTGLPIHYRQTALVQIGSQGKYFGTLGLHYKGPGHVWEDISPLRHQIRSLEAGLKNDPDQKRKRIRQLNRYKKQLKKYKQGKLNYYTWDMTLMDSSIMDDPGIKEQVEIFTPYPE